MMRWPCLVLILALAGLSACATAHPPLRLDSDSRSSEVGVASYYAHRFHGHRTASGERYDEHAFTAAHRSIPFGARVRVTRLSNGRSVVVRINDRGPFRHHRIIDLSRRAARELGIVGAGSARVRLELVRD